MFKDKFFLAIYPYFTVTLIIIISTFTVWLPFLLKIGSWLGLSIDSSNFLYVYRQYDGPLYIIPAKTLYNFQSLEKIAPYVSLSPRYFAAHLPLYPFLIRLFAPLLGYLKSMIFVNLSATVLLGIFFFFLVKKLRLSDHPLILTIVFLFLPRFLIVRSTGAPESLFLLLILLSLFFFEKEKYLLAGLVGGLATMTKSPGVLLFFGYSLVIIEKFIKNKKINWRWLGIILIPAGLLAVFAIYGIQYKDFLAYFHSGDNIHLTFPFAVFNYKKMWIGTAWLEEIVFYFFFYLLTVISLRRAKERSFFYFSLVFFLAVTFVQHRDISRYSLPLWPLCCIAFQRNLTSKKFLLAFIILLPAIYLYTWNMMIYNVIPVADWSPFL